MWCRFFKRCGRGAGYPLTADSSAPGLAVLTLCRVDRFSGRLYDVCMKLFCYGAAFVSSFVWNYRMRRNRNGMKKVLVSLFMAVFTLIFAVCAKKDIVPEPAPQTLKVGATPVPHAELLNLIREDLTAQNIIMEVIPYTDTVKANVAVITGELDANYMQHLPYLEVNDYWMERLIATFAVHIEPFAFYSSKYASVTDLPAGAVIAIPNDPANIGRALLLLETNGLMTLSPGTGLRPSVRDITSNPRGFRFLELPVSELPHSFGEADLVGINGNYALEAGLNPIRDSLLAEGVASPYVNIVVVHKDNVRDSRIQALQHALLSQKVKSYISSKWSDGSVVPVF